MAKRGFRNNIKYYLIENDINQADLAKLLDTTEASISRYVNDIRLPKIDIAIKMCDLFGCSIEDLYIRIEG